MNHHTREKSTLFWNVILLLGVLMPPWTPTVSAAGNAKTLDIPDFTKGDLIPVEASHDWNLGATGARGWIFSNQLVTTDARQIRITKVEDKSAPNLDSRYGACQALAQLKGRAAPAIPATESPELNSNTKDQ